MRQNRQYLSYTHCNRIFWNEFHLGKHLRTINEWFPINEKTGFEDEPEYQEMLEEKKYCINNFEKQYTNHRIINERIDQNFTYNAHRNIFQAEQQF